MSKNFGQTNQEQIREAAYVEAAHFRLPEDWDADRPVTYGLAIDNPTTRDRDDAIALNKDRDGTYTVEVSIADVSTFLPNMSATMAYATQRAETRYLRTSNIPMIPPAISENALSLNDNAPRPAFTVKVPVMPDGTAGQATFSFTKIHATNTTYDNANRTLRGAGDQQSTTIMREYERFAHLLLETRRSHGALAFYLPDQGIMSGADGDVISFRPGVNRAAQLIVQEFMILTNIAVAEYAAAHNVPIMYRNHQLRKGASRNLLQKLQNQEQLDTEILGRVYERARYSATLIGHAALNLDAYCHSTSPLRRGADIITQANIRAHLLGEDLPFPRQKIEELAQHFNNVQDEVRGRTTFRETQVAAQLAPRKHQAPKAPQAPAQKGDALKDLHTALESRIDEESLSITDVELLIGKLKNTPLDPATAGKLLTFLQQKPHIASAAFYQAMAKGHLISFTAQPQTTAMGFTVKSHAAYDKERTFTAEASAPGKKDASQRSAIALLADMLGVDTPQEPAEAQMIAPEQLQAIDLRPLVVRADENPKGRLQELLAKNEYLPPEYDTKRVGGTDTNPIFESTVTILVGEESVAATALGANKKDAELKAAQKALPTLQSYIGSTSKSSIRTSEQAVIPADASQPQRDPNIAAIFEMYDAPVQVLGDFCRSNDLPNPHYHMGPQKGGRGFWCTVTVTTRTNQQLQFTATAPSKQKVRQEAAAAVLASGHFEQHLGDSTAD